MNFRELEERLNKVASWRPSFSKTLRASDVGHPCNRYLFYRLTCPEKEAPGDIDLRQVFEEGKEQERIVLRMLLDAGVKVEGEETAFEWMGVVGHVDGFILLDGTRYPIEIKSVSPNVFEKFQTIDDIRKARKWYYKKWFDQLQIYLLLTNSEVGLFFLKNKGRRQVRILPVEIDLDHLVELEKKVKAVYEAVRVKKEPDRIPYCDICIDCGFIATCQPTPPYDLPFDLTSLLPLIEEKAELEGFYKRYQELDKIIKDQAKRNPIGNYEIGRWVVEISEVVREEKPRPAQTIKFKMVKIYEKEA